MSIYTREVWNFGIPSEGRSLPSLPSSRCIARYCPVVSAFPESTPGKLGAAVIRVWPSDVHPQRRAPSEMVTCGSHSSNLQRPPGPRADWPTGFFGAVESLPARLMPPVS